MNSRQQLPTNKTSSTGFIYKPGFVDDDSLESLKMAVDKELGLISNSFFITSESWDNKFLVIESLIFKVTALESQVKVLEERLEGSTILIENLETRVSALENKP